MTTKDNIHLSSAVVQGVSLPVLPVLWRLVVIVLTCLCSFGNHWSNGLIVALKTTIIHETHINNSQFATLVASTNLVNTLLCILLGFGIDKWGGAALSVLLAFAHFAGAAIMAGGATNRTNSFPLLVLGKVIAAIGDGSLDNAQHRIFSSYFVPGHGFAFSIGMVWSVANLGQFVGQATGNVITVSFGSYAWSLWLSAAISLFSFLCAALLAVLDRRLRRRYSILPHADGMHGMGPRAFNFSVVRNLGATFWLILAFAVFENAGVQSFVSISTQFVQQRLKKDAVLSGWVASFYLLLPVGLTPFLGVWIDVFGGRVALLLLSGLTFLVSMLLLRFSRSLPSFLAAYIFYALAVCVTPAPQVEIIRAVIPDPHYFATAFAIKKAVVQASIVIITTAAGKIQDDAHGSLDNVISLWLIYAAISVLLAVFLFLASVRPPFRAWKGWWPLLPAARLAQVVPRRVEAELEWIMRERRGAGGLMGRRGGCGCCGGSERNDGRQGSRGRLEGGKAGDARREGAGASCGSLSSETPTRHNLEPGHVVPVCEPHRNSTVKICPSAGEDGDGDTGKETGECVARSPPSANGWSFGKERSWILSTVFMAEWMPVVLSAGVVVSGWVMFGLGVVWGVRNGAVMGSTGE